MKMMGELRVVYDFFIINRLLDHYCRQTVLLE